jgi:hypothetical protein
VRAATTLAFSSSALEAHVAAQLAPVRRIERSRLRPDWHGYAASFVVRRSIAARKDNALLSTVNTSLANKHLTWEFATHFMANIFCRYEIMEQLVGLC